MYCTVSKHGVCARLIKTNDKPYNNNNNNNQARRRTAHKHLMKAHCTIWTFESLHHLVKKSIGRFEATIKRVWSAGSPCSTASRNTCFAKRCLENPGASVERT